MEAVSSRIRRQAQTRTDLVDAAERLFVGGGFHATTLDAVAAEAGYTKGAVYSNFASKEELFLAVYERRIDRRLAEMEAVFAAAPSTFEGVLGIIPGADGHREAEDGWLAVFFEFWAHVIRHPDLRERFAAQHRRVIDLLSRASVALARERGEEPPPDPERLATARYAMQLGLQFERLTQPDVVDGELARRMARVLIDEGGGDGLPEQAPARLRPRRGRKPRSARA
jgi:AcrR family transcriptional regulator